MDDERVLWEFDQIEGQMNIFDYLEEPVINNSLIAVSKIFARAIKQMNLAEWKTFVKALTQIRWMEANKNFVRLDKKEIAELIGVSSDPDHISRNLKNSVGELSKHSYIEFEKGDNWSNGQFISSVWSYKNILRVNFAPEYMPLFEELQKDNNYMTLWADDLFQMTTDRSILFYEDLRLHSDTRKENSRIYSTKDLKELFNIPKEGKGSYMHYSKQKNQEIFDRNNFEKYVLMPICEDMKKCTMIQLNAFENGGYWEKIKKHGCVVGYRFSWIVSDTPTVTTALENKEIREAKQNNPLEQKIKKDILTGEKRKPEKAAKNEKIHNFEERDYSKEDWEKIEKSMMENTRKRNEERNKEPDKEYIIVTAADGVELKIEKDEYYRMVEESIARSQKK